MFTYKSSTIVGHWQLCASSSIQVNNTIAITLINHCSPVGSIVNTVDNIFL